MSATDPQREALAELTEAVAVSGSTGAQPSADWCACIFEAHCHPEKLGRCKLRAGGTINQGGGVCQPVAAALAIDAPAIRAEGVAEGWAAGRNEALREVVAYFRAWTTLDAASGPFVADAIEAAFPTTGETT